MRLIGTVTDWNDYDGIGTITTEGGAEYVFDRKNSNSKDIKEGDKVSFDRYINIATILCASNVSVLGE